MADSGQRGFTLLEVLIALALAVMALNMLFWGATAGLRSTRISAHYEEALARAQSHLAAIGHGTAIIEGAESGDDGGGYRWQTRIAPFLSTSMPAKSADPAHSPRLVLYEVMVAVSWTMDGPARSVALRSQRIGVAAQNPP